MIELELEVDFEAVERVKPRPLVTFVDLDRLADPDEALGRILFFDSGRLQQEDKRPGAAVHDRHFGATDFDEGIVDTEAGEGRQQVLDGGDADVTLD